MSVVNHEHKYIFMHEPHTAGRAIEKALMEQHEGSDNFNGDHHICAIDMIDKGFVTEEQFEKYLKFRVIRNPYDWLVTCWMRDDPHEKQEFDAWVMTRGLGYTAKGTLFWRYAGQIDMNVRYENLAENLHYTFLTYDIPPVILPMVGKTENKRHWSDLLTVNLAKQLERYYSDILAHGYDLFKYQV